MNRKKSNRDLDVLERLQWVVESLGISGREFGERIGLKRSSSAKLLNGTTGLTQALANSIELKTGFSADWILNGQGLRLVDPRNRLSAEDQAVLEMLIPVNRETLLGLFFRKLETRINRAEGDFSLATNALVDPKALEELRKKSANKLKWIGDLSSIFDELQSGNLDQICIIPLILSLHFGPGWNEASTRSQEYRQMLSFGLKAKFEESLKKAQKILKKLDSLYELTPEQQEQLTNKISNSGEWIDPKNDKETK